MGISTCCAAEIRQAKLKDLPFKMEFALTNAGYKIGPRDPNVNPTFAGAFMVTDPEDDEDGYAIVGDDRTALVVEAYRHLLEGRDQHPTEDEYVQKVLELYKDGSENAFEVYLRVYEKSEDESDLDFVKRSASLDYDDLPYGGALYQELFQP
jgi:hypothetical protein